jgi:hypothetical protein
MTTKAGVCFGLLGWCIAVGSGTKRHGGKCFGAMYTHLLLLLRRGRISKDFAGRFI